MSKKYLRIILWLEVFMVSLISTISGYPLEYFFVWIVIRVIGKLLNLESALTMTPFFIMLFIFIGDYRIIILYILIIYAYLMGNVL